jgi:hypothetical protein
MIVALQYYEGDIGSTMSLARLLADIEPMPRADMVLAFVCQPNTPVTPLVSKTIKHCERKFPVLYVESKRGAKGHPVACTALWTGMMEYFFEHYPSAALLAIDGNDAVPVHLNWVDLMLAEHERTLSLGKLITGSPYWLGGCPLHVNPNAVFQMSVWYKEATLRTPPEYDGTLMTHFDIYHRRAMLTNASLSTVVRTDWQGAGNRISVELMRQRAVHSLWLHGYKDSDFHSVARQYLFGGDTVASDLQRYDLAGLYLQESLARKRA